MFILTANYQDKIPPELKDRMEIIELGSYTEYDKIKIARDYILPKILEELKIPVDELSLTNKTITTIIRNYTEESGVRGLERTIRTVCRKFTCNKIEGKKKLDPNKNLENILGIPKYQVNKNITNKVGVITGLSYTPYGGDIVKIEVVSYPGSGNIKITGLIGEIMQESIEVAFGYIKSRYKEFDLEKNDLLKNDFQVHVPSGAIKKDGPSAGITVITAILSHLKKQVIEKEISMSGEATLTGNILKVGGLKEKLIAALNNQITKIYLPLANKEEIEELEVLYKDKIEIIYVSDYQEIYEALFAPLTK